MTSERSPTPVILERFDEALQAWTDERFVSREEIRSLSMFVLYLVNLLEDVGAVYTGHSMRIGAPMCLLVVRGVVDEIPHVVFTSGRTPMACIRIFLRKLDEGLLEWSVDRYAR